MGQANTQATGTAINQQCRQCNTPHDDNDLTAVHGVPLCSTCAAAPNMVGIAAAILATTYHPDRYKIVLGIIKKMGEEIDALRNGKNAAIAYGIVGKENVMKNTVREKIADVQHAIWAHWMKYMFTQGMYHPDGSWSMPAEKVDRWTRQMNTPYSELREIEKESDRHQADKVIAALKANAYKIGGGA